MKTTAKLFQSGRSQAVRLPKEYRFEGTEVRIRREGPRVVLEPIERDSPGLGEWGWLNSWHKKFASLIDDEFVAAVNDQGTPETRPELKRLFEEFNPGEADRR